MQKPEPVLVVELFPELLMHLLGLLGGLDEEAWTRPTVCAGWSVKDVACHLLGDDVGLLSRGRDGYRPDAGGIESWEELVALINGLNEEWVAATRRLSPQLVQELLAFTGAKINAYFRSLDPYAMGGAVSWAGPEPAPMWLDLAREYTERWLHQQQIREAVDAELLEQPRYLAPVLATFVHALPQTYRGVEAATGTAVTLTISGPAGGTWSLQREEDTWRLYSGEAVQAACSMRLDQESAWRLFTRGLGGQEARARVEIAGDEELGVPFLEAVAIIA